MYLIEGFFNKEGGFFFNARNLWFSFGMWKRGGVGFVFFLQMRYLSESGGKITMGGNHGLCAFCGASFVFGR